MKKNNINLQVNELQLYVDKEKEQKRNFDNYITANKNKITDDLGRLPKSASVDEITGVATITTSVATYTLDNYKALKKLRVSTDKLLTFALAELFTTAPQIHTLTQKERKAGIEQTFLTDTQRTVTIPITEYIALIKGVSIADVETMNENAKKQVVKDIKEDLRTLKAITITQDKSQKTNTIYNADFYIGGVIESGEVRNGYVKIRFNRELATSLKMYNLHGKIPNSLLAIDGNHATAYKLGRHLTDLQLNQQDHKDRISYTKVIELLELPTPDELKQRRKTFNDVIYNNIDNALEFLVTQGVLTEYTYTKAKGEQLEPYELEQLTHDYEFAKKCYITFKIA